MGLLLTSEFAQTLQKEVGLSENKADAIAREINRFVFYPVKPALDQLHEMKSGSATSGGTVQKLISEEESDLAPQKKDLYRETIEQEE